NRSMKSCINEQRPEQKNEQTPMTRYGQADLVGGRLTENHAKHLSWGYKLKECDRCDGAGDDQNKFNVRTDHRCRPYAALISVGGSQSQASCRASTPMSLGSEPSNTRR